MALEVPPEGRDSFLADSCKDPALRAEVAELLEYATDAETYFYGAIQGVAQSLRNSQEASAGDMVGCYRIISLIGRGGMGSVYLAERVDGEIQQRVAIKLLRAEGHRPEWQDRFRKERQLLASLQHPSIVHVVDAGHTEDGRPFLVMEYVDGVAADTYAAETDVRERLKLFLRVCEGVSHAHRRLIIHRDLKPSNILVDGSGRPKLLDFGIARLLDEGETTIAGERLLTPHYASPEQIAGNAQTTATDVYSLGAVLYKLLTGVAPVPQYPGVAPAEPTPPSQVNREVPRDVDFIVGKALRLEPEERYASVDAFANDVRAALDSRPVQARSGNAWYLARKYLRRHWVPSVAGVLVVASLAAGLLVADRQRALAERRFGQLRQLASKVIDLDRAIRTLPGSVDARRRLVSASLEYLEGLSGEARGNLDLAQETADGYWRLGRIQGVNAELNLGDPLKAEQTMKKADALIEMVLASRPQDRNALFRSAVIAHDRMILANTMDKPGEALAHARRVTERLAAFLQHEDPSHPVRLEGLLRAGDVRQAEHSGAALLYGNTALTYVNQHKYAEGARYARLSVDLARDIPSAQDLVGSGLSVLANSLRYQGDLEGALQTVRDARQISEHATYPSETARLFNRYGPLLREGMILGEADAVNLGQPEEAAAAFQQALDLTEGAAAKDPNDSTTRSRLGSVALQLGGVLRERDPARALAVYDQGIARLAEAGNRLEARRDRARLLAESSYPLRRLKRQGEAKSRIAAAFALLEGTRDWPAASVHLGSQAYSALSAAADQEAETGEPRTAVKMYEQLLEKAMAGGPDPFGDLRDTPKVARLYGTLAVLYRRSGDEASADRMNGRRLELWRHWQLVLPGNAFVRQQLQLPESSFDGRETGLRRDE